MNPGLFGQNAVSTMSVTSHFLQIRSSNHANGHLQIGLTIFAYYIHVGRDQSEFEF